ncbi:VOC family protein [Quadrisphaera sp. KR29]|uniref:VOC family protein n=1 Tax=Quadrisphaera sp. KR29 TaxID=3461391 RepID=UPI0040451982
MSRGTLGGQRGMAFTRVLAQAAVSDAEAAERWYAALFDASPDARPMDGLLEWHLTDTAGVQVWREPARAGRSCVVLGTDDLDALADRLTRVGAARAAVEAGGGARLLRLSDPDGNLVVVTGA